MQHWALNTVSSQTVLSGIFSVNIVCTAPSHSVCKAAEREADTAYGEIKPRVDIAGVLAVRSYVNIIARPVKIRQPILVCAESVDQVLASEKEVIA